MRSHPIGTGPFKFVEFKPNERITVTRNPDYWKAGRPYLDGIEYTIIRNLSTATLAFVSGKFDMTFPYSLEVPLLRDVTRQMPEAICELAPLGISRSLIVNREKPPFDNPDLRQAMALSLDRQAFINIITEGQGDIGGAMQPPPEGLWGMQPDMLKTLPGYDPDVENNRADARRLMGRLGYDSANRLKIKLSVRDLPFLRDPAVILIDQLKEVYIDGELETIDTTNWLPKVMRKDYTVGLNGQGSGVDPDLSLNLAYRCGGELNYNGYCSPEVDKLIDRQSIEADTQKRKKLVWEIERKLAEDGAGRSFFTTAARCAGSPTSRGGRLWSTASSMAGAWKTCGSTNDRDPHARCGCLSAVLGCSRRGTGAGRGEAAPDCNRHPLGSRRSH